MASHPIPEDRTALYGQPLTATLQPWTVFAQPAASLAVVGAVAFWLRQRTDSPDLQSMAFFIGGLLITFAVLLIIIAWRIGTWRSFRITLDREFLEIPISPYWAVQTIKIPLAAIDRVHYELGRRGHSSLQIRHGGIDHKIESRFLSSPWTIPLLDLRIELRRALLGSTADEVAAVEAALLAVDHPVWGAIVIEDKGEPYVTWLLDNKDDYSTLLAGNRLPANHRLHVINNIAADLVHRYSQHPYRKRAIDMPFIQSRASSETAAAK